MNARAWDKHGRGGTGPLPRLRAKLPSVKRPGLWSNKLPAEPKKRRYVLIGGPFHAGLVWLADSTGTLPIKTSRWLGRYATSKAYLVADNQEEPGRGVYNEEGYRLLLGEDNHLPQDVCGCLEWQGSIERKHKG